MIEEEDIFLIGEVFWVRSLQHSLFIETRFKKAKNKTDMNVKGRGQGQLLLGVLATLKNSPTKPHYGILLSPTEVCFAPPFSTNITVVSCVWSAGPHGACVSSAFHAVWCVYLCESVGCKPWRNWRTIFLHKNIVEGQVPYRAGAGRGRGVGDTNKIASVF